MNTVAVTKLCVDLLSNIPPRVYDLPTTNWYLCPHSMSTLSFRYDITLQEIHLATCGRLSTQQSHLRTGSFYLPCMWIYLSCLQCFYLLFMQLQNELFTIIAFHNELLLIKGLISYNIKFNNKCMPMESTDLIIFCLILKELPQLNSKQPLGNLHIMQADGTIFQGWDKVIQHM